MLISTSDLYDRYDQLVDLLKHLKITKSYLATCKQLAKKDYDWQSHRMTFIKFYGLPKPVSGER